MGSLVHVGVSCVEGLGMIDTRHCMFLMYDYVFQKNRSNVQYYFFRLLRSVIILFISLRSPIMSGTPIGPSSGR